MEMTREPDVIVVGGGNAALSAAISAQEAGAKVLIVEKAPEAARGGNTRYTELYRFAYEDLDDIRALIPHLTDEEARSIDVGQYTVDQFYNDAMLVSGGRADPEFTQVMVSESYDAIKWLVERGVKWDITWDMSRRGADGITRFQKGMPTRAAGGGMGVIIALFNLAQQRGIDILYETKAIKILVNEAGRVCGIRVRDKDGIRDIKGKSVVLASGGFQADPAMRARYLGPSWDLVKVRGSRYDTGEGFEMARDVGAAATGHFSGCHATQVFLEGPDHDMDQLAFAHAYSMGLLLNVHAKRFLDEGEDFDLFTYAKFGRAVLEQPRGIGFQIFDQKVMPTVLSYVGRRYTFATPITAQTLDELARKLELDEETFVKTILEYNAAVQDGEYNWCVLDGKTTKGLSPNKTNWALPIDTAPFVAYPVTCGITFTYGGIKTNTSAQVLDTEGNPIPCLYAAGEVVGSFYFNYAGASGLIKGTVFGRRAGVNATADARS